MLIVCYLPFVEGLASGLVSVPGTSVYRDSDDDFRSGCRNVGQCHQQQSFSGLLSPGRSNHTND